MQSSTGFIAGVTVMFGIVALGMAAALVAPYLGEEVGALPGALAFGTGLMFLVLGRSELFTENVFDPVAAAVGDGKPRALAALGQLWGTVFVLNLVGGAVMAAVFSVPCPACRGARGAGDGG